MVKFPPLAPSAAWFADFFSLDRKPEDERILYANSRLTSPRDFARFSIIDTSSNIIVLSAAIEGGGRQLREIKKIPSLQLSEHGDWRKIHLGAINAALGRQPLMRHIHPALSLIYHDKELTSLQQFNSAIFRVLLSFLIGDMNLSDISVCRFGQQVRERGREIAENINPNLSVIQLIASFGKESLLGLLTLNDV